MTAAHQEDEYRGAIALAEKILALLDEGRFTATYKYAVLLALLDLALEKTKKDGSAPDTLVTREMAEKVLELYWPHTVPYASAAGEAAVLTQIVAPPGIRASILSAIERFRTERHLHPSAQLATARTAAPEAFEQLVRQVEWTLIDMPLPRLQQLGDRCDPFLYRIAWGKHPPRGPVRAYQKGQPSDFDNRIQLAPGVGEHLVRLNSLLRPLIHREWARQVARINGLEESRLEDFLFGSSRTPLDRVRPGLLEIQDGCCFYCGDRISDQPRLRPAVDHFIPRARYANDAIENLVVAHERCNHSKRDFLAAAGHVERWCERIQVGSAVAVELARVAAEARWESNRERSTGIARGIYLNLPESVPLWVAGRDFVPYELRAMVRILASCN